MPLEIITIPCLDDNYAFLLHDAASGETALIDAPETAPIKAELEARGWALNKILITHHHDDHIYGVEDLRNAYGAQVLGAAADAHRLPPLDEKLTEGDSVTIGAHSGTVIDVSGHSIGHIAFHFADSDAAFTADSLMALGCGRLFEGTPDQMWQSLSKLAALPAQTMIYSGHEYTAANAKFAATIEPDNPALIARIKSIALARADGKPTVPSTLAEECATNPFLRAASVEIRSRLAMENASDSEVFAEVRRRKDRF